MDTKTIELIQTLVQTTTGEYFWWFLAAGVALFCKNLIENAVYGLTFLLGSDYNVDDEVYLYGNKKARIVRQTINKTVFYIYEGNRRLVVPNRYLYNLQIETVLPTEREQPEQQD